MNSLDNVISLAYHEIRSTDDISEAISHLTIQELKHLKYANKKLTKIINREFVTREIEAMEESA